MKSPRQNIMAKASPFNVLLILIIVTVSVYSSRQQINDFLQSPAAANVLLIVLIAVDGLVPFLSTGWSERLNENGN
jgi:hypothetical protein